MTDVRSHRPAGRRMPLALVMLATGIPMFMATLDNLVDDQRAAGDPRRPRRNRRSSCSGSSTPTRWSSPASSCWPSRSATGSAAARCSSSASRIFTLASAAAALSTDPAQLIVARAVQGLGGAGIMPLSLTLLAGSVEQRLRPLAIGIWGGIAGLGVAVGPLIGGAVVEGWNWQAIFWINVPVGIIAVPLVLLALPNASARGARRRRRRAARRPRRARHRLRHRARQRRGWDSVRGARLARSAAPCCSPRSWCGSCRTPAPLLPLRLFRDRSFTVANIVGFGFSFGMFGAVFILIQFLQIVQGAHPARGRRA